MEIHALSTFSGVLYKIHAVRHHEGMTNTDEGFPERFSDALVSEIKAEMGRQSLSSRGLGRLIGKSSQYMSDRLDGGNTKTGKRVVMNVWDLAAIAAALGLTESELVNRAEAVAIGRVTPLGRGVGRSSKDLETATLDITKIAASTDNTPIDPSRGEAD